MFMLQLIIVNYNAQSYMFISQRNGWFTSFYTRLD